MSSLRKVCGPYFSEVALPAAFTEKLTSSP
jgi:hypothetical protein